MTTVAYLANSFPCDVEPYVAEEIQELRSRGVSVIPGSVRKVRREGCAATEIVLQRDAGRVLLRAAWLCVRQWHRISPLIVRVVFSGREAPLRRLKALVHTFAGACYAVLLEGRSVEHIHVHHGYHGSWIAMTASRLLGVGFSMTLHGSDLLLHGSYLDEKLARCDLCVTISEYNRRYILEHYPEIDPEKVIVARLGVGVPVNAPAACKVRPNRPLTLLTVGRLHRVKDHAFLLRACAQLAARGVDFDLLVAGQGPESQQLRSLVREYGLHGRVKFLGHVASERLSDWYDYADLVVLTSRSEGIPLVLMEAMARGKIVLAPGITGIPELVIAGKTGFLYEPGSMKNFLDHIVLIQELMVAEGNSPPMLEESVLARIRRSARDHVMQTFERKKNLEMFANLFLQRLASRTESIRNENPVLQQI